MTVEPDIQAKFERNLTWKRSWPRCLLAVIATVEILLALAIFATEILNIGMDFWHANVFGGIWASIILFINWILIFVTVCCSTTIRATTCSLVWNIITLIALATLIAFDIVFITNPYICLLTSTCSTQLQIISYNYIVQTISPFSSYSLYDSKKLFLEIQVGCAGLAFLLSIIYIVIFIVCRLRLRKSTNGDNPAVVVVVPPRPHGLRIGQAPPLPWATKPDPNQ